MINVIFPLQQDTGEPKASIRAPLLIESIRRHIPNAHIIHLTNEAYPAVEGVDEVIRTPIEGDFIDWCFESFLTVLKREEPTLQLGTDCLIKNDITHVFDQDFTVAACRYPVRDRIDRAYCGDIAFTKAGGLTFYQYAYDIYKSNPHIRDGWEGGQTAILQASKEIPVLDLPYNTYCATPNTPDDPVMKDAKIVHFRGKRKKWMVDYYESLRNS